MFVVILPCLCLSLTLGIDIGYEYITVSAITNKSSLHIVENRDGTKMFPNYFALWNISKPSNIASTKNWSIEESKGFKWTFGHFAKYECFKRPQICVKGFSPDSKLRLGLRGHEIISLSLSDVVEEIRASEKINESVEAVIAFNPSVTHRERVLLAMACRNVGIDVLEMVDSTTAPALVYALERSHKFANSSKTVAFIDLGSSGSRVSIFNFSNVNNVSTYDQLSVAFNESHGSSMIDSTLAYKKAKEYSIDTSDPKTSFLFIDDIRRAKESLALYPSVDLEFETDDDIINVTVTTEDVDEASQEYLAGLSNLIDVALNRSGLESVDIVEVYGGGSRLRKISKHISSSIGLNKTGRSLNTDGAVALGAGYRAAERSKFFKVKQTESNTLLTADSLLVQHGKNGYFPIFVRGTSDSKQPTVRITVNPSDTFSILDQDMLTELYRFRIENVTKTSEVIITFAQNSLLFPVPISVRTGDRELDIISSPLPWTEDSSHPNSTEKFRTLLQIERQRRVNSKAASDFENALIAAKKSTSNTEALKQIDTMCEWFEQRTEDTPAHDFIHRMESLSSLLNSNTEHDKANREL